MKADQNGIAAKNGNGRSPDLLALPSLCRGIYSRVAQKLGCDPSYVSRVARGQRTSQSVSEALRAEVQQTWALANGDGLPMAPSASARTPRRKPH
jgi:hypothetical protein